MERESFEDEEVADLLNRAYVSIKVDREEHPDLDAVFMETAMMMNQRGGWPLNLILTPERKPFYAATYIPKRGSSYTPGMMELLPQIEEIWGNEPQKFIDIADQVVRALEKGNAAGDPEILEMVEQTLQQMRAGGIYDHIGFGFHRSAKRMI